MDIGRFEHELNMLKENGDSGQFEYIDPQVRFTNIANSYFSHLKRSGKYGVYIVRQKSTREVLYIGKSGTITRKGIFKGQDIPRRLTNVKGDQSSNQWFISLVDEQGALVIEYIFLDKSPISPTLAESILIQSYFNQFGRLPYRNNAF